MNKAQILNTMKAFKISILRLTIFASWLIVGLLLAFNKDGWTGLAVSLVNIALICVYAVIINLQIPEPPVPGVIKRPKLEMLLVLCLTGMILLVQMLDFGIWTIQPWQAWISGFFRETGRWVYSLKDLPAWSRQDVYLALSSTIKQLLPGLLLLIVLGYGGQGRVLLRPYWKLTVILVGITAVSGLASGFINRAPIRQVLTAYFVSILINALPEELLFRGLMLPRLEKILDNPLYALMISSILFNAVHVPLSIFNGESPLMAMLDIFSIAYPSAIIWGYLYLRTRSILPGVLWHAANATLGFILVGF